MYDIHDLSILGLKFWSIVMLIIYWHQREIKKKFGFTTIALLKKYYVNVPAWFKSKNWIMYFVCLKAL